MRALERVLETENGLAAREDKDDALRLKRLQDFQIQVISKAMSFPAAEYIVYSTCSIHNVSQYVLGALFFVCHSDVTCPVTGRK